MSDKEIVLTGGISFGSTTFGIAQGFRRLGWDVNEINLEKYFPQYSSRFLRAFSRGVKPLAIRDYNQELLKTVLSIKPAAFVAVKGSFITLRTLQEVSEMGVQSVNYYPDYRFSYPGIDEATFSCYSHLFSTKSFQIPYLVNKLGSDKVTYLPHGYQPDAHRPLSGLKTFSSPRPDLLYIGNYSASKESWLAVIKQHIPQILLHIYGNGWRENANRRLFQDSIIGRPLVGDAYARAIRSAKITLAIHMGPSGNEGWQDLVSTRTFEIPACKGFMLHIDNDEVRQFFTPEREIDVFSTKDDLCEKVEFYVNNESLREAMTERAYTRCVPAYSYDERASVIAKWIDRHRAHS